MQSFTDEELQRGHYENWLDEIGWQGQRETVTRYMAGKLADYDGIIAKVEGGYNVWESPDDLKTWRKQI